MKMNWTLDIEKPRTKRAVSPEVQKREIEWNKEGKDKLRGAYGQKLAGELEETGLKNIR